MSVVSRILDEQRSLLIDLLSERLGAEECRRLLGTSAGSAAALVQACVTAEETTSAGPVRDWANEIHGQAIAAGATDADVFAALSCLQRSLRLFVVRQASNKRQLVAALSETEWRVERLRQAYLQRAQGGGSRRDEEADLAAFVDQSPHFVCLANMTGKPRYFNRTARQMLGLPEGELPRDLSLHRFYTEAAWEQLRDEAVPAVNERGQWEGRSELRLPSGATLDVYTSLFVVRRTGADRPSAVAWMHRDASRAVDYQRALSESEGRKRAILESALDPIATIDGEGRFIEFNRAAEQVFGFSRDRVLGTRPADLLFPADRLPGQQERIDRYLSSGEGSLLGRRVEITAVRANGETFPAEMAMAISYQQGLPVMTLFFRDISLRKQAEEVQRRHATELERSNRELEQFAYVASHDLQEPLRKIRIFSDRLIEHSRERLDETGRECLARIDSAAIRMQTLIEGLLTLSRVTTRSHPFQPVDLGQVAHEVVSDLEAQIHRSGGRVEIGHLPTIEADALQMRQLLQNLIANGLKFHRPEEPPVVQLEGRFVSERGQRPANAEERCRIVVEDNGIGFDEKYQERIFGAFQRLHPRDAYEGTGIGLAICRRITERHGGAITAHSVPGHGSRFEILLPVRQAKRLKPDPISEEDTGALNDSL